MTEQIIKQCRELYPQAKSDKAAVDLAAMQVFKSLKEKQEEYHTLCQIRRELEESDNEIAESKDNFRIVNGEVNKAN